MIKYHEAFFNYLNPVFSVFQRKIQFPGSHKGAWVFVIGQADQVLSRPSIGHKIDFKHNSVKVHSKLYIMAQLKDTLFKIF